MNVPANARSRLLYFGVVVPLLVVVLTGCFGPLPGGLTTGSLYVLSEPEAAEIFLDGKPTGHKTPYRFTGLEPGVYDVTLVHSDYPAQTQAVEVKQRQTQTIRFTMNSTTVTGRVVFGRSGPPVADSTVRALPENSPEIAAETITGPDGSFTLNLPPGRYDIIATQPTDWAVGIAQSVIVPTSGPVEIIQRDLFAYGAANPQILSIKVTGLEPGDVVTEPVDLLIEVKGQNSDLVRFIGVRVGHEFPDQEDIGVNGGSRFSYTLNPGAFGPGSSYLHVVAYDAQYNAAQLIIPFTIPPNPDADGEPLPAPAGLDVTAFTFLTSNQSLSVEALGALADALSLSGVILGYLDPELIPPYNRWIVLRWEPVPGATGYRIYRRAEGSNERAVVANWPADRLVLGQLMYIDGSSSLSTGTRYYYSIRAYDEDGQLGRAGAEVPVVLLEPFEARLVEPIHHAYVPWADLPLRWQGSRLPPLPGYEYDYVYTVAIAQEAGSGGLANPAYSITVHNQEETIVPKSELLPAVNYQWDLLAAYATVEISESSRAFSLGGRYHPLRDRLQPTGGSVNGAFLFTPAPQSQ